MKTDYIFDADKKIISIIVDGKKVKPGFMRGIKKAQATPYWEFLENERTFQNPFSGAIVALNALEATIYNWCNKWYQRYTYQEETFAPIQTYDDMKYFLCELNSNAYMELMD
jgi:hypothetical protein